MVLRLECHLQDSRIELHLNWLIEGGSFYLPISTFTVLTDSELNSVKARVSSQVDNKVIRRFVIRLICWNQIALPSDANHVQVVLFQRLVWQIECLGAIISPSSIFECRLWDCDEIGHEREALQGHRGKKVPSFRFTFLLKGYLLESCGVVGSLCIRIDASDVHCGAEWIRSWNGFDPQSDLEVGKARDQQ